MHEDAQQQLVFHGLNMGAIAANTIEAHRLADKLDAVRSKDYQVRFFESAALGFAALRRWTFN